MKIIVNSKNDLKKFYKRLKYYKYLFFVKFESDNNEIQDIITALNIKKRNKRIEYVYDYSCKYIDNYWENINYCGFKCNKCYCQQYKGCKYKNGCCRLCKYQSDNGCITSNLTCKFYYCTEVLRRFKTLTYNDIKILKLFSFRQKTIIKHSFFNSREEVLFDLKYSLIIVFAIKLLIKNIIRIIYINKRKK